MTALVSPLTRVSKAGVSGADFTALESSVAGQIDTKNAAQLQQINLDYADRPTTYNKSEVYTKTESDAALQLKGSAAQLATVTAYANTLPTLSTVNSVLNARFIAQDSNNFVTYGALSNTTANTAAIATATAATVANQSGIAAVNANIASILTGNSALETLNVFNEVVGGSNRLEIKNKPDALNTASLQIEHELTASAQLAKVNFWDTSIPNSSSTSSATALTLSWDGDADTHTSTFAGGLSVTGTMACTNLICTGIATMPGGGASAGQVLNMSRTEISNGNNFIATNGSKTQIWSHAYTPTSASSYLLVDIVGVWTINAPSGSDDGQWKISLEVGGATIGSTTFKCLGSRESGSTSPVWGQYTNSSIAAKNIVLYGQQTHSADQGLFLNGNLGANRQTWIQITEVQR